MGLQQPTFKEKFQRFKDLHFNGKVTVKNLARDTETGGYRIDIDVIEKKDVDTSIAVHESGNPYSYTIDRIRRRWPYRTNEKGFSAIDLNLWMESNEINDCLAYKWNGLQFFSSKKVWLIIGIAAAVVIAFYVLKGGF